MILLDIDINSLLHIGELIILIGSGFGAYWKLNNKVDVLEANVENNKTTIKEKVASIEIRMDNSETKLEEKIQHLEEKIDRLPKDIIELFRQLK